MVCLPLAGLVFDCRERESGCRDRSFDGRLLRLRDGSMNAGRVGRPGDEDLGFVLFVAVSLGLLPNPAGGWPLAMPALALATLLPCRLFGQ